MTKYNDDIIAGQATYTPFFLNIYDLFIIKFSNRYFWRCPPSKTVELYQRNLSPQHLDIGVGTGYYLQTCHEIRNTSCVGIMDLNRNSLQKTKDKLEVVGVQNIQVYQTNVLDSFPFNDAHYTSVGINYLLHCIPGSLDEKLGTIFHNVKASIRSGKIVKVFGSTIIIDEDRHTALSRAVMRFYHKKGIFHNQNDTYQGLVEVCNRHSKDVSIKIVGAVAFFEVAIET